MQTEYEAPKSALDVQENKAPRSSIVAILFGGLFVDFLGTMLIIGVSAVAILGEAAADPEAVALLEAPQYAVPLSLIGILLTFSGGYVASRWARNRPTFHGAGSGLLSFLISAPFLLAPGAMDPLWLNIPLYILHVPIAILGGRSGWRDA